MGWREKGRPGTGLKKIWFDGCWRGWKRGPSAIYRHPRTTQERRAWDPEYGRAKRSPWRLVNAWDDVPRDNWNTRSWKRYRSHQWRCR